MAIQMIEMLMAAQHAAHAACGPARPLACAVAPPLMQPPQPRWRKVLALIALHAPLARRSIAAGNPIQRAGDPFLRLHLVNGGACKSVTFGGDGRQQIVALHFRGDWVGLDGIAYDRCASDAYAMIDCEIWSVNYATLLKLEASVPALAHLIAAAMSEQIGRNRTWRNALGTLPAVQRVADFLFGWHQAQREHAPDTEAIVLCMTRAEIGNYLGLTVETVSRALSQLEQRGLIRILAQRRRHIGIPDRGALCRFAALGADPQPPHASHQHSRALRPDVSGGARVGALTAVLANADGEIRHGPALLRNPQGAQGNVIRQEYADPR